MKPIDESLEREGYEHSNSLSKCPYHLCEMATDIMGNDYCECCQIEAAERMQEIDDQTLGEP